MTLKPGNTPVPSPLVPGSRKGTPSTPSTSPHTDEITGLGLRREGDVGEARDDDEGPAVRGVEDVDVDAVHSPRGTEGTPTGHPPPSRQSLTPRGGRGSSRCERVSVRVWSRAGFEPSARREGSEGLDSTGDGRPGP